VAMTRPKRHLCIIGDSDTISKYVLAFPSSSYPARRTTRNPKTWAAGNSVVVCKHTKPAAQYAVTRQQKNPCLDTVSLETRWHSTMLTSSFRGSKFLKSWMEFLEENADLRYPNLADVYVDGQNG
jgi:hypothetical protein